LLAMRNVISTVMIQLRRVKLGSIRILAAAALFLGFFLFWDYSKFFASCPIEVRALKFHGGDPATNDGSCTCGTDGYCMCTPSLAIDAIIEVEFGGGEESWLMLVRRRDPPADVNAIVGGFVEVFESVETAVAREVKEETNLVLDTEKDCKLFGVYSDPKRDKRRHTVSIVYRCSVNKARTENVKGKDDARAVEFYPLSQWKSLKFGFDHRKIFQDYMGKYHPTLQ